jgi:hypothetical protein
MHPQVLRWEAQGSHPVATGGHHNLSTSASTIVQIIGRGQTGQDGCWQFPLTSVDSIELPPEPEHTIAIIATPLEIGAVDFHPNPVYLVAKVRHANIGIWSFTSEGQPAALVQFTWQCSFIH